MNVFACMVITANGYIDIPSPHKDWVPESSWQNYLKRLKDCQVAIIGSKNYQVMGESEFLPHIKYFVYTNHKDQQPKANNVNFTDEPADQLIAKLKNENVESVGVFGGAVTLSEFIKADLIDDIFLDVAAYLSGEGKNLLTLEAGERKLKLVEVIKLDNDTVQLHYQRA